MASHALLHDKNNGSPIVKIFGLKMKILYLAHRIPFPPNKGDKIRSYHEVKNLALHHDVDLLCLVDEPGDLKYKVELGNICRQVAAFSLNKQLSKIKGLLSLVKGHSISSGYFYQSRMQRVFDSWVKDNKYDAIVCFSSPMAEYIFRSKVLNSTRLKEKPRLVMDFCDVDSDKWRQYAVESRFLFACIYHLENRRLASYERHIHNTFDRTILISEAEAELFKNVCSVKDLPDVIPNGVDYDYFTPYPPLASSVDRVPKLVFTGAMDYQANVDGIIWFCDAILPQIKVEYPNLELYVVGSHPTAEVSALAKRNNVFVTGFVDDIRSYYGMADISVVPLRIARGVQNKVLEAMAMGKAVVTTSKANEGIQAVNLEHLIIADDIKSFSRAIIELLQDRQKCHQLGLAAREFVLAKYNWKKNIQKFENLLTD